MSTTIEATDEVGESDSVGVEVTGGVEKLVVFTVTAKYEHAWTHSCTFSQSLEVKVPPHSKVCFTHEAPTLWDTGTFTVTLGNTAWNVTGGVLGHTRRHRSGTARGVHPPHGARQRAGAGLRPGTPRQPAERCPEPYLQLIPPANRNPPRSTSWPRRVSSVFVDLRAAAMDHQQIGRAS